MNLDDLLKEAIAIPEKRSLFLQTLIKSDVYVICRNPVKPRKDGEPIQMELITTQNPDGDVFIPFFTSFRSLQQFAKRYVNCYKLNCLRLFDLIQSASAVLNPNSYGKEFSSQEIKSILMIARNLNIPAISMNEEETIEYRPLNRDITHLTRTACKYLSKQPNVDRAFAVEMVRGCEKPQVLFVFDMMGNTRKLFFPLSKYMASSMKSSDSLCFLSLEQEAAKKAIKGVSPFYVRKKRFFEK
ncbi:MAG: enhanced serine sensitivity protein SseB [Ruminococcus sp.]|nr:enhanced serine sensitivity protein SseB [Ruminococcus sp.]MBQ8905171.1 enhanced serine sensitivity protein SseB C-terminal domain-containing protein [Ruminococcus sp.]